MVSIQQAKYEGHYKVWLKFNDCKEGVVDLVDIPSRYKAAAPLHDENMFASFMLDEWPTLTWPCGFDLSPEFLYERMTGRAPSWTDSMSIAA